MTGETVVRVVVDDDLPAIAELYAHYVSETTLTWVWDPPTVDDWRRKAAAINEAGLPFLVIEQDGALLGFAYLARYRDMIGWDGTVEDTIYLAPEAAGRGLGSGLLAGLVDAARNSGRVRQIVAMISGEAAPSIRLHSRYGFEHAGVLRRVGYKHGRLLDCILMQLSLDSEPTTSGSSLKA